MQETKQPSHYRQTLRGRILETAMTSFAQNGIRAVKMDDIAQSLGISKRTLYEIYDNKELLLLEGVKKYHQIREEEVGQLAVNSPNVFDFILRLYRQKMEEFRLTNPQFYADIVKYPSVLKFFEQNKEHSNQRFVEFLKRGVGEGYFRKDVDLDLIAMMFTAITDFIITHQLYKQYNVAQILHDMVFLPIRGFCTADGVTLFDQYFAKTL